jgi:formylglycine-generating enzyme required for sulfatase activity
VEFFMGSPETETGRSSDEIRHRRKIDRSFAIGCKTVTVAQWRIFLEAMKARHPKLEHFLLAEYAPEPDCPIMCVTWHEAAMYCRWLSELEKVPADQMVYPSIEEILNCPPGTPLKMPKNYLSRTGYRLPTEAEHEYGSRAGADTRWYFGSAEEMLPHYAWFLTNGEDRTWPVGQKKPNRMGLFDSLGNVWNWCEGCPRPYNPAGMDDSEADSTDPEFAKHVSRGGSWTSRAGLARAAARNKPPPTLRVISSGFRLARTLPGDHFAVLPPKP